MGERMKAVIFDMDGVLVDSEPLHFKAWQALVEQTGASYQESDHHEFRGRSGTYVATTVAKRYKIEKSVSEMLKETEHNLFLFLKEHAPIRPGVKEFLKYLKEHKIPCAVASSSTSTAISHVLDLLDLSGYFQSITCGQDVEHSKPAPDIFLLAAKRLNVQPADCLVIEDSENGVNGAKAAGMTCVAVPCLATMSHDLSKADYLINNLSEIFELKALFS
jgi:beta-phosphoglucomutase family hydrolase